MGTPLYYLGNARTKDQTDEMVRLERDKICIFCPQNFGTGGRDMPFIRTSHWSIFNNQWPYTGTLHHFLIVPDHHVAGLHELTPATFLDLSVAVERVVDQFKLMHYGIAVRNGDNRYTGGTIVHLHVHLTVGDPELAAETPVRVKLSSAPKI
jgi:ATP adenylyltransferase